MKAALAATGAAALGLKARAGQTVPQAQNAERATPLAQLPDNVLAPKRLTGKTATSRVPLGKSGIQVSMVGMGTGTSGSRRQSNQTRLGDEGFTRLVRHAMDNGINFFDLADQYGSNPYFARAAQGVQRDKYVIQTKCNSRTPEKARQDIDRYLQELQTDYIDSLIIHCVTEGDWTTRYRGVMDVFEEAKQAGKIRAHGVTCHSFAALQAAEASDWVEINMVRWNAHRSHMDADVETVRALFQKMRAKGQGMIGMKVLGEGDLVKGTKPIAPEECFRFQVESGVVDAFVIGMEKTEHVDQLIRGTQAALDQLGYPASPLA
jgi:predicted aldo/keto reductase-like oxidoreductase